MSKSFGKRGQKIIRRFSRLSQQVEEESKEHIKENFFGRISHIHSIRLLILEWGLLVFALIMFAITQAIWFDNSYANDTFISGGTYTEGTLGRVASLNPLFAATRSEKALSRLLFATLTTTDYTGHTGPGLAKSVSSSSDGKVWTIKLRDNLKWSDGEPLTNADVLFTVSLIQNPAVNSVYDSSLANVRVTEGDDGSISFSLPSPYADFSSALNLPIVPKHILENAPLQTLIEHEFSTNPVVSGPFKFNALQLLPSEGERTIYLSANPYYYKGRPLLDSFAVHTYNTENDLVDALESGKITATADISPAKAKKLGSSTIYQKRSQISSGVYAFLNLSSSKLSDRTLRQSIRQAVDWDKVRALTSGEPKLDFPLVSSQIELSKYPELAAFNIAAADQGIYSKLDALSNEVGKIPLRIVTVNSGYLPAIAQEIADQLNEYSLDVSLTVYDEGQDFINTVLAKRAYDILIYEIELGADPDLFAYYHSSQATSAGLNLSNYKNALADDLILAARETTDRSLRAAKYEGFLKYWYNDVPAIGIYQSSMSYLYNKNVRAYNDNNRLVTPLDRFFDVETWAVKKDYRKRTP